MAKQFIFFSSLHHTKKCNVQNIMYVNKKIQEQMDAKLKQTQTKIQWNKCGRKKKKKPYLDKA
jgi:hypothetical protein